MAKWFTEQELTCRCGCGDAEMKPRLMDKLDALRDAVKRPIKVNSAKRCVAHNEAVGGAQNSAHITGEAVDLSAVTAREKYELVTHALLLGFQRIGVGDNFVHMDVSMKLPHPALWSYGGKKK